MRLTKIRASDAVAFNLTLLPTGWRAARSAKLHEIIVALKAARNEVVGLEHGEPAEIEAERQSIEEQAVRSYRPVGRGGTI